MVAALAIVMVIAVLLFELVFVSWRDCSLRLLIHPSATVCTDALAFFLVETNIALFVGMAMLFGVTYFVQSHLRVIADPQFSWRVGSPLIGAVLFFLVNDLSNYWTHRLCHRVPLLWQSYHYRHSTLQTNVLTAASDHPMESAFAAMVSVVPAALLSLPSEEFLVLFVLAKTVGFIKHSNLTGNWGWFRRLVVQSPAAHWIHHSTDPAHHNRNFASLLQFWDLLFDAVYYTKVDEIRNVVLGFDGGDSQKSPFRYIVHIFVGFLLLLAGGCNV